MDAGKIAQQPGDQVEMPALELEFPLADGTGRRG
jgi:hypothetical protein